MTPLLSGQTVHLLKALWIPEPKTSHPLHTPWCVGCMAWACSALAEQRLVLKVRGFRESRPRNQTISARMEPSRNDFPKTVRYGSWQNAGLPQLTGLSQTRLQNSTRPPSTCLRLVFIASLLACTSCWTFAHLGSEKRLRTYETVETQMPEGHEDMLKLRRSSALAKPRAAPG